MEQKYPHLLKERLDVAQAPPVLDVTTSSSIEQSATALDVGTVVKATQTLAQEVRLEQLLDRMLRLLIENAAAQRGVLLIITDERWQVAAEAAVDEADEVSVLLPGAEALGSVPERIINYVTRSQKPLVLDDARNDPTYATDPYIRERQSQSLLCLPLVNQGQLTGIAYLEHNLSPGVFTAQRLALLDMLSAQMAISLDNARIYEHLEDLVAERTVDLELANVEISALNERLKDENLRMTAELDVTRQLQQMLLPTEEELSQIEGLEIAGFMDPAEEVGGDYYDVLQHEGRLKIGIGDVTGHGLESGVVMLMIQTAVRTLLTSEEQDPVRFMNILNQILHDNMQRIQVDKSMSLTLLDYQLGQRKMNASGQHEQMLIVRQGGQVEALDTLDLGFPLGLEPEIAQFVEETSIDLQPGDGIVLYSDGITEAENVTGEFYGMERLCNVVSGHWVGAAEAVKDAVVADVRGFIGDQTVYDDLTLLVVKQK